MELLVVIGIIALLIGILLPALTKARKQAQGVQCLSNLRQISNAALMFTNEHNNWMVARYAPAGAGGFNYYDPYKQNINKSGSATFYDNASWIAPEYYIDPFLGTTTSVRGNDQNLTYSGIAKYLGFPYITSCDPANTTASKQPPLPPGVTSATALPNSAQISANYGKLFTCPADETSGRPGCDTTQNLPYRYSYELNDLVASPPQKSNASNTAVETADANVVGNKNSYLFAASNGKVQRVDYVFNGKITSIKHPSDIIMFVCADPLTIKYDTCYVPDPSAWDSPLTTSPGGISVPALCMISTNHYNNAAVKNFANATGPNKDGMGNVSFCDGHAEAMSRKDALRQKHTSSADPDPTPGKGGSDF